MSSEVETSLIILRHLRFDQGRWVFGSCAPSKITLSGVWLCFYVPAVIDSYSRPQMRAIWSDERKFQIWLEIETIACEAMARLGLIPKEDAAVIRKKGKFEIDEIAEVEKRTNHDVIAFLENVASYVGPAARWIHQGLTSSDILDTTLAVQMTESAQILADDLAALRKTIGKQARRYKKTPMIGRSHGIHAEPITFGLKLARTFDDFGRARVVRGNALAALENVVLWHERDISHSSAERVILPDSCTLLDYMLVKLRELVGGLRVYPENMKRNLEMTKGLYFSQSILLALTRAGFARKTAYEAVQRAAMKTWRGKKSFAQNVKAEPKIIAKLSAKQIDKLCSLETHFRDVDEKFKALGLN